MTNFNKAYRLYLKYQTQTAQYKELAAAMGHTVGSFNAMFCRHMNRAK